MTASFTTLTGRRNACSKSKSTQPVPRLAGSLIALPAWTGVGIPMLGDVPRPVGGGLEHAVHELLGCQLGPGGEPARCLFAEQQQLDPRAADIDGEDASGRHG